MDARTDAPEPDELLAQLGWVRALAGRLVADPDVTDDVLQQVCLLALQRVPSEARTGLRLRAWLVNVTRRLARHSHRADARRRRREQVAARAEALPSTVDAVVHREALQGLVSAVTALQEPYYSVVVARYFEGRPVAEIAALSGASPEAVRQQLARARQQLRARLSVLLAEDTQGRLRAALPLAALPGAGAGGLPGSFGGLLVAKAVGTKLGVALLVLIALVVGTWYAVTGTRPTSPGVAAGDQQVSHETADGAESPLPRAQLGSAQPLAAASDAISSANSGPARSTYPPGITTYVVSGRVVDEHGRPWPGAVVRSVLDGSTGAVLGLKTWSYEIEVDQLPSVTTDAGGRFSLTNPWKEDSGTSRILGLAREPVLIVEATGMAWHVFLLANHDGRDRDMGDLVLSMPAATLLARVVDEHGMPVADVAAAIMSGGAVKSVRGTPGLADFNEFNMMGLSRVHSDAEGRVVIKGLWPSQCALSLIDPRHQRNTVRDISIGAAQTVDLGDVVLARGGEVAGVVRDRNGLPVAGAEVWTWDVGSVIGHNISTPSPEDWEQADPLPAVMDFLHDTRPWHTDRSPAATDAEGHFSKPGLTGDRKDVFVEAEGFEPLRVPDAPVDEKPLELVLAPETNLDVLVVDARSGDAVAGATLRAFHGTALFDSASQPSVVERRVTPGAGAGAFVVHTIGRHGTRLLAGAPGHALQRVEVNDVGTDGPVTVRLDPACSLTGRVAEAGGKPLSEADLTLRPAEVAEAPDASAKKPLDIDAHKIRTDAHGAFEFPDLPSGAFLLDVRAHGFMPSLKTPLEVAAGTQSLPTIVMQRACSITGTVTRADGTPAEGLVVLTGSNAMSKVDRSGGFGFDDLGPGDRTLRIADDLGARPLLETTLTLGPSEQRVVSLVLPRTPVVHALVTAGGAPVGDASLHAVEQPPDAYTRAIDVSAACDAGGRATLSLPLEGQYRLRAERRGGGATLWISLDATWGLDRSIDFDFGMASVAGRVLDANDGSAPPDMKLRLVREGEPVTDWLATGAAGEFDIPALLAGSYVLLARSEVYPETHLELHLEEGQRLQDLRVLVSRGALIEGLVVDSHGQPVASWVYLVTPGQPPSAVQYGAPKGSFQIVGLAAGHYRVVVAGANYAEWVFDEHFEDLARGSEQASMEVELTSGEHRRITLQTDK